MSYRKPKGSLSPAQRQALPSLPMMQEAILEELLEAGVESLLFVVNRVHWEFSEVPHEALLSRIEDALDGLQAVGIVTLDWHSRGVDGTRADNPHDRSAGTVALTDLLAWDDAADHWWWNEEHLGEDEVSLKMPIQVLHAFRLHHPEWNPHWRP